MANKNEIANSLRRAFKSEFITRQQVAVAMGYGDPHSVDQYLNGLQRIGTRYFIEDVAQAIASEMK